MLLERLIIVLLSLTIHEMAHGLAADKLGDYTARIMGRLSLNPLRHLDPIGFICMLFFGFGWAKPVPVNVRNFKKPRRDMALTALAGPVSNLLLALVILLPYEILYTLIGRGVITSVTAFQSNLIDVSLDFIFTFHYMNLTLALFNFIPVPPLDGSRILYVVLPDKLYFGVMKYERYISIAIMLLLYLGLLDGPLSWMSGQLSYGMHRLWTLLPFFLS